MPNIAELVPSVYFSVHNHGFCDGQNTFSQENARVYRNSVTPVTYLTRVTSSRVEVHIA